MFEFSNLLKSKKYSRTLIKKLTRRLFIGRIFIALIAFEEMTWKIQNSASQESQITKQ